MIHVFLIDLAPVDPRGCACRILLEISHGSGGWGFDLSTTTEQGERKNVHAVCYLTALRYCTSNMTWVSLCHWVHRTEDGGAGAGYETEDHAAILKTSNEKVQYFKFVTKFRFGFALYRTQLDRGKVVL